MKALVTGVAGFCGPHLVSRLRRARDIQVFGFDRMDEQPAKLDLDGYLQGDITEAAAISAAVKTSKPDCIFHLAGLSAAGASPACVYEVNLIGTVHLLEAVRREAPQCRVLLVGSFAEYGAIDASSLPVTEETPCRPIGPYGISKHAATLTGLDYSRRSGVRAVVARPANIIGAGVPPSLVVGAMLARAKQALNSSRPVMKVGDFDSERDFIGIADVVDAYVRVLEAGYYGEIFNICSGRPHSIRDVAEALLANAPRAVTLEFDADLVPPSPVRCVYGSYEKAERLIGFRPTASLEENLKAAWVAEMGPGLTCESRC